MADCKRVECGDCLSLFRYFVNQQPALLSDEQTITPECPIGYHCDPADPIILEEGRKRIIPDVGPYDPDIDPNCDYDCERNIIIGGYDPHRQLQPTIRVWNDEQKADCQDIDPTSTGTAEVTVLANTLFRAAGSLASVPFVKAQLNQDAFDRAKAELQAQIDDGTINCFGWESTYWSDGCATQGGRVTGTPIAFDFLELDWNTALNNFDGEICPSLGYVRVDQTQYKEFGPFVTDMTFLVDATGTWNSPSSPFTNAIVRVCVKTPAQLPAPAPPVSMLVMCSGAFYPGTSLLSWGGAEPANQQTTGTLPAGQTLYLLVGIFLYGQISGGPYVASATNFGSITFTPVP